MANPFSLFTGAGLIVAYALLGCTWLIMKTAGNLQRRMVAIARPVTIAPFAMTVIISVRTRWFMQKWLRGGLRFPHIILFAPLLVLVVGITGAMIRILRCEAHTIPFMLVLFLLFLGFSDLAISLWPNIIPPSIPISLAAASPESMGFTLVGALFFTAFILVYTAWSYYVFRGKVKLNEGYH